MESIDISFGTCPSGENCEIIRSIDNGTFPHQVSSNETFINHVHEHHPELKTIFPRIQEESDDDLPDLINEQESENQSSNDDLPDLIDNPRSENQSSNDDLPDLIDNPRSENQSSKDDLPDLEESNDDLPNLEEEPVSDSKVVSSTRDILTACIDGEEKCLLRRAINDRKTPFDMEDNPQFLAHIEQKHPYLRSSFSEENLRIFREEMDLKYEIRRLLTEISTGIRIFDLVDESMVRRVQRHSPEQSNSELKCFQCSKFYDKKIFLNCGHHSCSLCVINRDKCKCGYPIDEDLKKIILSQKKEESDEEDDENCCPICTSKMNTEDQTKFKVLLKCECSSKTQKGYSLCLGCANECLKDKSERKVNYIFGIPMIDENPTIIKGTCPVCKTEPTNKQELFDLFKLLPPSL
jgi:hypothetical protein